MPLLKLNHGTFSPAVEEPLEEVSLADWLDNPQAHAGATALVIANDEDLSVVRCDVHAFSVIILEFPRFGDGRAYTQARLLRERFGYEGEIRARGDVLRDQIFFMARCGIDGFETAHADAASANEALQEFSFAYQRAADSRGAVTDEPIWRRRLSRVKAA